MSDSPEAVRERIHAEELAKGSDPRVAEARAKAAEARARHGLPLDPQEAWKVKLANAGKAPTEPAPAAAAPEPEPTSPAADAGAADAAAAVETPPAASAEEPKAGSPQEPAQPIPAAPAQTPAAPEPVWEPEIGDVVEPEAITVVRQVAGISVVDARVPARLMLVLLVIPMWAILYLLAAGSSDPVRASTGCVVKPDHSFVCFQSRHEEKGSGGGH